MSIGTLRILICPHCGRQHVDERRWVVLDHEMHYCLFCKETFNSTEPCIGVKDVPKEDRTNADTPSFTRSEGLGVVTLENLKRRFRMVEQSIVQIEEYQKTYGFSIVERLADVEPDIERLKQLTKDEPFKRRREYLWAVYEKYHMVQELGVDKINLPILWRNTLERDFFWETPVGLFLGGVEVSLPLRAVENEDARASFVTSLYVGPMPNWVVKKYKQARTYFPKENILVVSRHKQFFSFNPMPAPEKIVRQLSPLMIAVDKTVNGPVEQYLLAAWGLEYELNN